MSTQYDALNRVTSTSADSEHGALATTHSYDSGFRHRVRNPRQYETVSEYFALDEPDEKSPARITLANGTLVEITRDIFGSTTSITRSGQGSSATRSYAYDSYQRVCKTIEPETGATVITYDTASNVLTRAPGLNLPDPATCTGTVPTASKITFTYDAMNRLKNTTFGDGSPGITRTYTPDGLPLNFTSNGAAWVYTYNKRRLLSKERLTYSSANYDLTRSYNPDTSLASLTYPDNSVVAFAPNALNEASQVGSYASNISYHANGAVAGFSYGNGIVHSMVQNERGLPEQVGDSGVLNDVYSYDENGNVTGITDQQENISTRSMGYDEVDRLVSVNAPNLWGNAAYTYDALDNLTGSTLGGATARSTTHQFDSATNRLTGITSSAGAYNLSYGYDVRGNITQRGAQAYVFDVGNRMSSATGKATYTYDAHGRRVKVVESNGTNRIQVYDQAGQLRYAVQTGGPNPAVTTKYIYLNRHVLAEVAGATVQYSHSDALGSPVARTSAAAAVLNRTRYEPYGMTAAGANPSGIGFTGHVNDTNTGLVYMQQRYYDPVAARLLSIDPVITDVNTGGNFNRYSYANDNPYKYVDPDGRFSFFVHWGITLFAAKSAGYSFGDSIRFANRALMSDFDPGAQETTKDATAIHAMRTRGEGIDEAMQLNSKVVSDSIASGDLGKASHAIQDRFASGHADFTVWEGFKVLGLWGTLKHILTDTFPSAGALSGAYKDTKTMFESQKGKQQEKSNGESNSSLNSGNGNVGPQGCMAKGGNCW